MFVWGLQLLLFLLCSAIVEGQNQYFTTKTAIIDASTIAGATHFVPSADTYLCRLDFRHVSGSVDCEDTSTSYWGCGYTTRQGENIPYVVGFLNNGTSNQLYPYQINSYPRTGTQFNYYCGIAPDRDGPVFSTANPAYVNNTLMTQYIDPTLVRTVDDVLFAYTEAYTNCNVADNSGLEVAYVDIYQCDQPPATTSYVYPVALSIPSVCFGTALGSFTVPSTIEVCGATITKLSGNVTCDSPRTIGLPFGCDDLLVGTYIGQCPSIPCTRLRNSSTTKCSHQLFVNFSQPLSTTDDKWILHVDGNTVFWMYWGPPSTRWQPIKVRLNWSYLSWSAQHDLQPRNSCCWINLSLRISTDHWTM